MFTSFFPRKITAVLYDAQFGILWINKKLSLTICFILIYGATFAYMKAPMWKISAYLTNCIIEIYQKNIMPIESVIIIIIMP